MQNNSIRQELRNKINTACDVMRSEGLGIVDYMEQLSWLFFLKAFDETENDREIKAKLKGEHYERILQGKYMWSEWTKETGDDLIEFVNGKLLPHLSELSGGETERTIATIFSNVSNRMKNGYMLKRVIDLISDIKFHPTKEADVEVLSEIYESLLKNMSEGGYLGEYYTPRHLERMVIQIIKPKIGETIYDPCAGTCGFLTETFEYFKKEYAHKIGTKEWKKIQYETFYARELVPRTYVMGLMNTIMHGIEGAKISRTDTLSRNIRDLPEHERFDVIMTNPPYGGTIGEAVLRNFPIPVKKTEMLFLQHIMASLKDGGRAAVFVPEGVLFRGGAEMRVRKKLLTEFNLHTVISLPPGVFLPYTPVKTNIIFFEKKGTTKDVWFYDLKHDGFELKPTRKPMDKNDIPDLLEKWEKREESEQSWLVPIDVIAENDYNLTASKYNPHPPEKEELPPPEEIVSEILAKEQLITEELNSIMEFLENNRNGGEGRK